MISAFRSVRLDHKMEQVSGHVAFISGAAMGIGRATALAFARKGVHVVVADINELEGRKTVQQITDAGGKASFVFMNVKDPESVKAAVAAAAMHGSLEYAVNNAGIIGPIKPFYELTLEEYDEVQAVNLRGVFLAMKEQIPLMLATSKSGSPAIVCNVGITGMRGAAKLASYTAAKHGVLGLVRSAAREVGDKIRINAVCPGMIETPMTVPYMAVPPEVLRRGGNPDAQVIPQGCFGKAEDVADTIVFMCMQARYMNGEAVVVDGGWTC